MFVEDGYMQSISMHVLFVEDIFFLIMQLKLELRLKDFKPKNFKPKKSSKEEAWVGYLQ